MMFSCCSEVLRVSAQKLNTMAVAPGCRNIATVPRPPEGVISTDVRDIKSSCAHSASAGHTAVTALRVI